MDDWISVEERLPEVRTAVLVKDKDYSEPLLGYRCREPYEGKPNWFCVNTWQKGYRDTTITHWMPLPEPPEEPDITEDLVLKVSHNVERIIELREEIKWLRLRVDNIYQKIGWRGSTEGTQ